MAYVAFVATMVVSGVIASLIDVDTTTSRFDAPDYHLVPFAGAVFGA